MNDLSELGRAAYKTKMCADWDAGLPCTRGDACSFAHGDVELQSHWAYVPADAQYAEHWVHKVGGRVRTSLSLCPDACPLLFRQC